MNSTKHSPAMPVPLLAAARELESSSLHPTKNVLSTLGPLIPRPSFLANGYSAVSVGSIPYATGASPTSESRYPCPQRARALMALGCSRYGSIIPEEASPVGRLVSST